MSDEITERIHEAEAARLIPEAMPAARSLGREEAEDPHPYRTVFMRDRDRILHTKAFRRLAHKTQVFLAPEGDHYRVRLTHTLEVTQIARTIARALRLNEDLTEAICLGHDLGHTPFGHLGEEVLSKFLGHTFRHNEQSVRIVEHLEGRAERRGLNLTKEVRDGILNHTWTMPVPSTLEGQVARYADRIAYVNHDLDDAVRAGVLTTGDIPQETRGVLGETSSQRIDSMVSSLIRASESSGSTIAMEDDIFGVLLSTRDFLFERVYQRPEVRPEQERAAALLEALCDHYAEHPDELPEDSSEDVEIRLADYVAGMTDRFAIREYARVMPGA